jgi:hypothetical protein
VQIVRLTQIWPFWRHVAQIWPVESLSMTSVSPEKSPMMLTGKPESFVYVSVDAL